MTYKEALQTNKFIQGIIVYKEDKGYEVIMETAVDDFISNGWIIIK